MSLRPHLHGFLAGLVCLMVAGPPRAASHPDRVETALLWHFATGVHPVAAGEWPDLTHRIKASVIGTPALTAIGPAQGLSFNGITDRLELAATATAARPFLPVREFSIAAWVMLRAGLPDGGIAGFIQDNGDFEKGWLLGYSRSNFVFRLASAGTDDGDGRLVNVVSRSGLRPERWNHLVATYDGAVMKLYVNGQLESQETKASGPILYPEEGRLVVGAYVDSNELNPMDGALYEIKAYARVMTESEIREVADRNRNLLTYEPSINRELKFEVSPYLQYATHDSVRILAETTGDAVMRVEYAEVQPLQLTAATREPRRIHELAIGGLKPFTRYFYRVTCEDAAGHQARSEIRSFQTLPPKDMPWSFGVIGDTQRNPDITRRCGEVLYSMRPNVVIHCGDVVDDGFAKHQWVKDLFEPLAPLLAYVPIYPVIGNHERNSHWYYDYFSLPAPEYYYSFKVGNAEFFMIDSNKDCGPGSEQYRWLDKALAQSRATWKFTAHHHPCFSSDNDDYGDHLTGKPKAAFTWGDTNVRRLVPLYEKHGVDIAFAGHIHSYERTWPIWNMTIHQRKGVRYVVSGGGGGGLEQAAPQRAWFTVHVKRGHHICHAAVHDRTMEFKAYDVDGHLFDSFQIIKD